MNDGLPTLSRDAFYGGRVLLNQPEKGFRATSDAILLAAAVPQACHHVLELGAGVGAATLALSARLILNESHDKTTITAVERDAVMAEILRRNITENDKDSLITVLEGDALTVKPSWAKQHDLVMINPPYNDAASTLSDDPARLDAMAGDDLIKWIEAAHRSLVDKGRLVMICRADRLDEVMAGAQNRFGDLSLKAIHTAPDRPAKRIILSARKGVGGPVHVLPPLMMRDEDNTESPAMRVISHDAGAIDMIPPGRGIAKLHL